MQTTKTPIWHRIKARLLLILPITKYGYLANFKSLDRKAERILCATAAGIGDTIMVAEAVTALKARFPDAKLSALAHYNREANQVFELMPCVDEIIDIGLENYKWANVIKFMLGGFWKLLFKLRKKNFELVIIFMPNIIRRLLLAGIGSKYWIYGNRINDYPGTLAFELLRLVDVEQKRQQKMFKVPVPENADEILPDGLPRPLIGIHPFCGLQWSEWKKFELLQEELHKTNGTTVVIGKKEGRKTLSPAHNLVNKLSITELFWVIKNCDVFVTADSGPMHIAFAMGTPTVALFGVVNPNLRLPPWGQSKLRIMYKPSAESKKIRRITERRELDTTNMQKISVHEVLDAVKELLSRS